jgi:transposase
VRDEYMIKNKDVEERYEYRFIERQRHRQISDIGWISFQNILRYKCNWYGKNFIQIGRYEPSSRLCSCGYINHELRMSDREWECPKCHVNHDRDILAANNIKFIGLEQPESKASGLEKSGLREEITAFRRW